jgi:hypothetical protein
MSTYLVRVPALTNPANVPSDLALMQADINKFLNQVQNRVLGGTATIPFRGNTQQAIRVNFARQLAAVPVVVAVATSSIWYYCVCSAADTNGFTLAAAHAGQVYETLDLVCDWIACVQG